MHGGVSGAVRYGVASPIPSGNIKHRAEKEQGLAPASILRTQAILY